MNRLSLQAQEDMAVLGALLQDEVVGVARICAELGFTEVRVRAGVDRLTGLGCQIEPSGTSAFRLASTGLATWEDYLRDVLTRCALPIESIRIYRETASTQALAKTLVPEQTLVLADHQTKGRGRLGRAWLSTPGACVLMSITKRVTGVPATHDLLSMFVGVGIARAIEKVSPTTTVRLKWPNDIMVGDRKLAGILIEATSGVYVIGIGLNVSHQDNHENTLDRVATCLADIGRPVDRLYVIEALLTQLGSVFRSTDTGKILDEWRSRASLGKTQTFEQNGRRITGEILDLDPNHGLIVRRDTGEIVTLPAATTSVVK